MLVAPERRRSKELGFTSILGKRHSSQAEFDNPLGGGFGVHQKTGAPRHPHLRAEGTWPKCLSLGSGGVSRSGKKPISGYFSAQDQSRDLPSGSATPLNSAWSRIQSLVLAWWMSNSKRICKCFRKLCERHGTPPELNKWSSRKRYSSPLGHNLSSRHCEK